MKAVSVGSAMWVDVDTPMAHSFAEKALARYGAALAPAAPQSRRFRRLQLPSDPALGRPLRVRGRCLWAPGLGPKGVARACPLARFFVSNRWLRPGSGGIRRRSRITCGLRKLLSACGAKLSRQFRVMRSADRDSAVSRFPGLPSASSVRMGSARRQTSTIVRITSPWDFMVALAGQPRTSVIAPPIPFARSYPNCSSTKPNDLVTPVCAAAGSTWFRCATCASLKARCAC